MSQDILQNLYASMPDRIASCIRSKGGSTGIEPLTTGPPHTNTIAITAQSESRFVAEDDLVLFRWSPILSCVTTLQTEASLVGAIGNTHSGRHETRCLVRRLATVREDTGARSEGDACIWTAANEVAGSTRECCMM
ncbi:hypothetical protein TNCV_2278771 [Trichonephila clavipes]|uniref:Uncharacterized protein n=1 Tax=Trichonephila clavipes TaxID=2585209 RepID=A0A8X6V0A0_TRICX|nr:hypothetical protein TNCV_2278771 [Trichonephila clavipes]